VGKRRAQREVTVGQRDLRLWGSAGAQKMPERDLARPEFQLVDAQRPDLGVEGSGAACRALPPRPVGPATTSFGRGERRLDRGPLVVPRPAGGTFAFSHDSSIENVSAFAQHDGTLDHVLQLTDIARPVVRLQERQWCVSRCG